MVGLSSSVVLLAGIAMVIRAKIGFMTSRVLGIQRDRDTRHTRHLRDSENTERLLQLASAAVPDTAALVAALKRQRSLVTIYLLIMLSTIWAMVVKPA